MSLFRTIQRAWCADGCGARIVLTRWTETHGQVCMRCYIKAMEKAAYDEERRSLRGYLPEELERI